MKWWWPSCVPSPLSFLVSLMRPSFDAVDGPDVNAVGADHFGMLLNF